MKFFVLLTFIVVERMAGFIEKLLFNLRNCNHSATKLANRLIVSILRQQQMAAFMFHLKGTISIKVSLIGFLMASNMLAETGTLKFCYRTQF